MTEAPDATYWTDHLRNTVQFAKAVDQLGNEGPLHFIEIGPGASTLAALRECTGGGKSLLLRSLTFKKGDRTESFYFLDSIGKLYTAGMHIN
jgi:acyl transferase domain-containing protein